MYRSDLARPACRHDPAWRNTGFRTAATACRGGGNARLRSSSPPLAEMRTLRMLVTWSGAHFKNRNKNTISSSEVAASQRMYLGALPPRGAGHTFCSKSGKYAAPGLGCHRCYSAIVEMRTKGEVISNPGRRLALCVAPYFADRGVGDMRGPPNGVPNMPPRRWWQAVIVPRYTTDTQ